VAAIVKRAVQYGLKSRSRPPVHVIGIDEVSRRKGQVYLTVVYDLERRVVLWVGDDRVISGESGFNRARGERLGNNRMRGCNSCPTGASDCRAVSGLPSDSGPVVHELHHGEVVTLTRPKAKHYKLQRRLSANLGADPARLHQPQVQKAAALIV
jgi:hypothetical protein